MSDNFQIPRIEEMSCELRRRLDTIYPFKA